MRIGVLGLGEAGSAIARDLRAAGAEVRGFDPLAGTRPNASSEADAAAGADLVLSLTTAAAAFAAARAAAPALAGGRVYADANTGSPALKLELAGVVEPTGALFADIALMAPVPGLGIRTPALVSGAGADGAAAILSSLGMPIEVVDGPPGVAATRKLLRSVAWKGVAAVVVEALAAADAAGMSDWMRGQLLDLFAGSDDAALDRFRDGSRKHAVRRAHEMADVAALLEELGVASHIARAAQQQLEELAL